MTCPTPHASGAVITGIASEAVLSDDPIVAQLRASQFRDPNIDHMIARSSGVRGYVYVVEPEGHAVCKVGSADFMALRIADLQCGAWATLRCVAAACVVEISPIKLEFAVHRYLKAAERHVRGEWFAVSAQEAAEAIVAVASADKVSICTVAENFFAQCEANEQRVQDCENVRRKELRRKLGMD